MLVSERSQGGDKRKPIRYAGVLLQWRRRQKGDGQLREKDGKDEKSGAELVETVELICRCVYFESRVLSFLCVSSEAKSEECTAYPGRTTSRGLRSRLRHRQHYSGFWGWVLDFQRNPRSIHFHADPCISTLGCWVLFQAMYIYVPDQQAGVISACKWFADFLLFPSGHMYMY